MAALLDDEPVDGEPWAERVAAILYLPMRSCVFCQRNRCGRTAHWQLSAARLSVLFVPSHVLPFVQPARKLPPAVTIESMI